ncbi:MAG: hypothetical protein LBI29_02440 [Rickettsiales bacterium]|jgi:hypothetical protein|nr:hypothetical protein [Rickettsiales bacterium]
MTEIEKIIDLTINDRHLVTSIVDDLNYKISNIPSLDEQNKFIQSMGCNGAEEIISDLGNFWKMELI